MVNVAVTMNVDDFGKWKTVFDGHQTFRKDAGCQSDQIFQSKGNSNNVLVVLNWDNKEKANKFIESDSLKKAMQESGMVGKPNFYFSG